MENKPNNKERQMTYGTFEEKELIQTLKSDLDQARVEYTNDIAELEGLKALIPVWLFDYATNKLTEDLNYNILMTETNISHLVV